MIRRCVPLLVLLAFGCSSGTDVTVGDHVIQPFLHTPSEQSTPGQVFQDFRIRVINGNGDPQAGQTIAFTGDGTIDPASAVTGADGTVSVTWSLPTIEDPHTGVRAGIPGDYHLTATVNADSLTFLTSAHAFGVGKVDATFTYACGISAQQLWCWGGVANALPVAPAAAPGVPVHYQGAGAVTAVAAANSAVCVLQLSGAALCSTAINGRQFTAVSGVPSLLDLSDGDGYFCGRAADLTAWCWQTNGPAALQAAQVSSSLQFTHVGAGGNYWDFSGDNAFGCGLTAAGEVWCWGANGNGQLGNGTTDPSDVPVLVSGGHHFARLEVANVNACAAEADNTLWCWGWRGVLTADSNVPVQVAVAGVSGPMLTLGEQEVYIDTPGGIRVVSYGQAFETNLDALGLGSISADGQLCALTEAGEAYCSAILLYGGGDTFLTPAGVMAVPRP